MRIRLLPLVAALVTFPLAAQLGYRPEGIAEGLRLTVRVVGEPWGREAGNGGDRLQGGRVGSGRPIDGLAIGHAKYPLRLQVETADGWLPWVDGGVRTGAQGKPILGIKVTSTARAVRYRASFVGKGVGEWAAEGSAARAGGAPVEAVDVEVLDAAPKGAPGFEYRVAFAGAGFTRWLEPGETAEAKGAKATAFEVRGGLGIRSEVRLEGGGWLPTAMEGETAGDPKGGRGISALRLYCDRLALRYRVRPERGDWGPWQADGGEAVSGADDPRIVAIQLDVRRAAP